MLAAWADTAEHAAGEAWPELPQGIVDRPAEVWEPLLAVAEAAGGDWPHVARAACVELCRVAEDRRASLGIRLLAAVRTIFGDADSLHTETIDDRRAVAPSYRRELLWDAWQRYLPSPEPVRVEVPDMREPERGPPSTCPRCAGEGCRWCGDTGRHPEAV
ncbi:hypothetical protein BH24PSE2_BH24PSE2_23370 [soil metagenome]